MACSILSGYVRSKGDETHLQEYRCEGVILSAALPMQCSNCRAPAWQQAEQYLRAFSSLHPWMMTRAPCCANARAQWKPVPSVAPVTRMVLPLQGPQQHRTTTQHSGRNASEVKDMSTQQHRSGALPFAGSRTDRRPRGQQQEPVGNSSTGALLYMWLRGKGATFCIVGLLFRICKPHSSPPYGQLVCPASNGHTPAAITA